MREWTCPSPQVANPLGRERKATLHGIGENDQPEVMGKCLGQREQHNFSVINQAASRSRISCPLFG
jgi:hypothetical protein